MTANFDSIYLMQDFMCGGGLVKKRESPDFRSPEVGISAREFCFFSWESYFTKPIENFFPVLAYPDINTRGVGRILDSYVNPRRTVSNSPNPSRYANTENVFRCLNLPCKSFVTPGYISPVSTVFAMNTWHHDPLFGAHT